MDIRQTVINVFEDKGAEHFIDDEREVFDACIEALGKREEELLDSLVSKAATRFRMSVPALDEFVGEVVNDFEEQGVKGLTDDQRTRLQGLQVQINQTINDILSR